MPKKFCTSCLTYKDPTQIIHEWRGRGSRRTKKTICVQCKKARDAAVSVAERDKFGRKITQRNKIIQSIKSTSIQQEEKRKRNETL